jgi:hypothetical protein
VSSTSIWVPISSAFAALFGAGLGAMLQGRYGASGWRRQIRLEAYTGFLNKAHYFDSLLFEALSTIDKSNCDERLKKLEDSMSQLQLAAGLAIIAGPRSVETRVTSITQDAHAIIVDARNRDSFISIAHSWRKDRSYDKWHTWVESAEQFTPSARMILKTD